MEGIMPPLPICTCGSCRLCKVRVAERNYYYRNREAVSKKNYEYTKRRRVIKRMEPNDEELDRKAREWLLKLG
jgi:hypothetical protein